MARRPSAPIRRAADLSPAQMGVAIKRLEACIGDLRNFNPQSITRGDAPEIEGLQARIRSTVSQVFGEDTHEFEHLKEAWDLDCTSYAMVLVPGHPGTSVQEIREGVSRGRERAIALLQAEIDSMREALSHLPPPLDHVPPTAPKQTPSNNDIFVVHGHDGPAKMEVARLIERAGLNAVILHEQPNEGRTVAEKLEHHGGAAGFAVVILTPDDVGGPDKDHLQPRARQNVVGELFWFAGKLSRSRVCALMKGKVEIPSDFAGVVYTDMDERGAWKGELLKELSAAGYNVNWVKAMA